MIKDAHIHLDKNEIQKIKNIKKTIEFLHSEYSPFAGIIATDTDWLMENFKKWLTEIIGNQDVNFIFIETFSSTAELKLKKVNIITDLRGLPIDNKTINFWKSNLPELMQKGYEIIFLLYRQAFENFQQLMNKKDFVFFDLFIDKVKIPVEFEHISQQQIKDIDFNLDIVKADLIEMDDIPDESDADILFQLGLIARFNGAYDKALEFFTKAQDFFEKMNLLEKAALVTSEIGYTYAIKGETKKAFQFFSNAYNIFKKLNDKLYQAKELINIGNILMDQGNYDKAYNYYKQAQKITDDFETQKHSLINLGIIMAKKGKLKQALEYYYTALDMHQEITSDDIEDYLNIIGNIGLIYGEQGKLDQAWEMFEHAFYLLEKELYDKQMLIQIMNNFGIILHYKFQTDRALKQFSVALKAAKTLGLKPEQALIYYNLGLLYKDLKQYSKAIEMLQKALDLDKQNDNKEGIIASLSSLAEVYILTNNFQQAQHNLTEAQKIITKSLNSVLGIDITLNLADLYSFTEQLNLAQNYLNKAQQLLPTTETKEELFKYKNSLAIFNAKKQNLEIAKKLFNELISEAQNINYIVWKQRALQYAQKLNLKL